MYKKVKKHLQNILAAGAIDKSKRPFSSNVDLVQKQFTQVLYKLQKTKQSYSN